MAKSSHGLLCLAIGLTLSFGLSACSSKTGEDYLAEGNRYYEQGNYSGAVVLFKSALEKEPDLVKAKEMLALAYKNLGKWSKVAELTGEVVAVQPAHHAMRLLLAEAKLAVGDAGGALEAARQGLELAQGPAERVEALALLGRAFLAEGKLAEGEKCFLEILQSEPASTVAHFNLARVRLQRDDLAGAQAELDLLFKSSPADAPGLFLLAEVQRRRGDREQLVATYRELVRVAPENPVAKYRLGLLLLDGGNREEADRLSTELAQDHPKRPEGDLLKGIAAFARNDFKAASEALGGSLRKHPRQEAYFYLSKASLRLGELETALSHLNKVLEQAPDFLPARLMYVEVLLRQKRLDAALAMAQHVVHAEPGSAAARTALGSALVAVGRLEEGMAEYDAAVSLEPEMAEAHFRKGLAQASQGDMDDAAGSMAAALKADPDNLGSRMFLFGRHVRQGELDKAEALMRQALDGSAGDALAYTHLGQVDMLRGNLDAALELLGKAKQADPDSPAAYVARARIFLQRQEREKAVGEYRELLSRNPRRAEAAIALAVLLGLDGKDEEAGAVIARASETDDPQALLGLARHLGTRREFQQALALADKALSLDGKSLPALLLKGDLLLASKKPAEALAVFESVQSRNPGLGLSRKIGVHLAMGDHESAMAQARRIIDIEPESLAGYLALASLQERQGRHDEAVATLKAAAQRKPIAHAALLALGEHYMRRGAAAEGKRTFTEVAKANPGSAQALFGIGRACELAGEATEAIEAYERALKARKDYAPAMNNLAVLYAKGLGGRKGKDSALELAYRAFQLMPQEPSVMDTLGVVLLESGRKAEAVRLLERAAASLPDNPTVQYNLARAYAAVGKTEPAREYLSKALEHQGFPEAKAAQKLLQEII